MKSVDTLNIFNLAGGQTDIKSYDSKNSTMSTNKSNSFDSCLKKSFNNTATTNVSTDSQDKVSSDANASNENIKDQDTKSNDIKDENDKNGNAVNSDLKSKINSDEGKSKIYPNEVTDDKTSDETNDYLQSILSTMLGCFSNGSFDISKLKTQLDKLKVPEDFQKVIINLATKLQDIFNKSGNDKFVKLLTSSIDAQSANGVNDQSAKNEHSKLIDNIIDVLESKLKEGNNTSNLTKLSNDVSKANVNSNTEDKSEKEIKSNDSSSIIKNVKDDVLKENLQNKPNVSDDSSTSSKDNKSFQKSDDSDEKSDDFLKKLLSQDESSSDSKISKVTTFINQFSSTNANANIQAVKGDLQVINKNNFAADIVKSVKYMQDNNIKELTVKINPKELGEVVIRLSMESNVMKASISAQNKETYNLLQSSLGDINNSLNNQNIKIQAFSVNIYNDTTYFSGQGSSENRQNNQGERDKNSSGKEKNVEVENKSEGARVDEGKVNMLA
ncbi:flagellar hook-length control protein FliK [Clostridium neuense]|uniref:Flagellar hook-length control protein FliK n=1 Tax=Clostridium neuense TaxID=1728934 RepID=A0ABW8TJG2_9CLOT